MKTNTIDFNQRLNTFKGSLRSFAFSFTKDADNADDLVQDTFVKAIRYAQKFQEGTNLKSWLFIILRNTFINNYRRKNKLKIFMDESMHMASDHFKGNQTKNEGEGKCTMNDIQKAMSKLSPDYYIPFIKYFEGYKYHEIADELHIPIGTVKTRIHIARKILKKNLHMYEEQFLKVSV